MLCNENDVIIKIIRIYSVNLIFTYDNHCPISGPKSFLLRICVHHIYTLKIDSTYNIAEIH